MTRFARVLEALDRRLDLTADAAAGVFLAVLAVLLLSGCSGVGAQAPPSPVPREVISDAPVCARTLADGRVIEGPEVCASTPAATRSPASP